MNIEEILQTHVRIINEQGARIATLEYILAQTLTIALRQSNDPESILRDMQTYYAEKMLKAGITADAPDAGFDTAERIFTTAATNI